MRRAWPAGLLVIVTVATVAAISACGAAKELEPPAPLELTQADSDSTQAMRIGQELRIALPANPSTGYRWAVDGRAPAQLEAAGKPAFTARSDALGAAGTEVWRFVARSAGEGTLTMKYGRSFEPGLPPAGEFRVVLRVD